MYRIYRERLFIIFCRFRVSGNHWVLRSRRESRLIAVCRAGGAIWSCRWPTRSMGPRSRWPLARGLSTRSSRCRLSLEVGIGRRSRVSVGIRGLSLRSRVRFRLVHRIGSTSPMACAINIRKKNVIYLIIIVV